MRIVRIVVPMVAIAGVVLLVGAASASAQAVDADRQKARAAYAQGQSLFEAGKYEEALAVFQSAYDVIPNPIVLMSIAECNVRLGKIEDAVTALDGYLAERPDAKDRPEIEKKLADLRAMPTVLVVKSTPAGAAIRLDGKDTGQVTPAELPIERGEHTVEASLKGYDVASTTLTAKLGSHDEIELALPLLPPPPPPPKVEVAAKPAQKPPPKPDQELPTTALWISGIVGGVGLVSGTVLGILALGEQSDFDAHPSERSADRGERLALFADVSFGIGAMAVITGAVLLLTSEPASGVEPGAVVDSASVAPSVAIHPLLGRDRAALSAELRF